MMHGYTWGSSFLSFVERLSWRLFCIECTYKYSNTKVLLDCPLLRGLSSFRVSFIGGSTIIYNFPEP